MNLRFLSITACAMAISISSCSSGNTNTEETSDKKVKILTLDPAHFHAALVQKTSYADVDTNVYVYAPKGGGLDAYLALINQYNTRAEQPTHWNEVIYDGDDFADKLFEEKKGNVLVLAGNNQLKTDYITRGVENNLNVFADKPMAIDFNNFKKLEKAFATAEKNKVLLYDIMTERSEITNALQKELINNTDFFGELQKGSPEDPAVFIESVHYFYKHVSGKPLVRPEWFFDPTQQGDAIADVGTHLVDLVQWKCFPEVVLDYNTDIDIYAARLWPTPLTLEQYASITGKNSYPDYLRPLVKEGALQTHANGEMQYTLKNHHVKIIARWDYKAEEGGDTHHAIAKGTKATVEIKQTKTENFKPVLYVWPTDKKGGDDFDKQVADAIEVINQKYPGNTVEKTGNGFKVIIPAKYDVGHEAHFGEVMERYLEYLKQGALPKWEVSNMIAKYYTTTKALEKATEAK